MTISPIERATVQATKDEDRYWRMSLSEPFKALWRRIVRKPKTMTCPSCDTPLLMQDSYWYCPNAECELSPELWEGEE